MTAPDPRWMRLAIDTARAGIAIGQSPFAAVVVRAGDVVGIGHNEVWRRTDPTAHAEVVAIQRAAARLRCIDLSGCEMFTTCEPCPMCAAAIHWARIGRVWYGATIADAAGAGFNELRLAARDLYAQGGSEVTIAGEVEREACANLFAEWSRAGGRRY